MKNSSLRILLTGLTAVVTLSLAPVALAKHEAPAIPDFTHGGKIPEGGLDVTHDWNLGPTGARGWFYSWNLNTAKARQILVTEVAKGSPAAGILSRGDVILGAGGRPFDDDSRIQFAKAIAAAEEEQAGGSLQLLRWRAGQTENVTVKLPVLGTYSDSAPYDCPKSQKIFDQGCQAIARKGLGGVSIPNDLNALALLASGKAEYRPLLAAYARKVAAYKTDSMATWLYGYATMFLAEYVMATHDTSVMDGLKRLALESARGQSSVGTWGHKFARPDGHLNGYGCMNQPGLSLTISMVLARDAGVEDPVLDRAIAKAASFLRWYVNKGAIPYGDHRPWDSHDDNGKCSSAAVLFDLLGDREAASFFSRMATAAYDERESGHTGNFFNVLWAMPGVSRCGPLATSAYWKEQSWYYDLARRWDGSFLYQGEPGGGQEFNKHMGWDSTGAYLLAYALPLKSLCLTGKKPSCVPALNAQQTAEVIAAGRDYYSARNNGDAYVGRTADQLLAGLSSWSPAVRLRSANALGKLPGNFVPALVKLLASPDPNTRYGACKALGCLGSRADAAAPELRAMLKDPDPWMQSLACEALPMLSPQAREASVDDLLNMTVSANPNDPRWMAQRAACMALFSPYPGTRGSTSILANSLQGVDRQLLYPAVKSVLTNQDSVARGSLGRIYGKLTDRDLAVLLPAIVRAVRDLAPSDEMFGDGIRLAGLDLLSKRHIAEGMPLCVDLIEPQRWGSGKRIDKCLECLRRYGGNARSLVPALQKLRASAEAKDAPAIDNLIAYIQADTNPPKLQTVAEFVAKN